MNFTNATYLILLKIWYVTHFKLHKRESCKKWTLWSKTSLSCFYIFDFSQCWLFSVKKLIPLFFERNSKMYFKMKFKMHFESALEIPEIFFSFHILLSLLYIITYCTSYVLKFNMNLLVQFLDDQVTLLPIEKLQMPQLS